MADIYVLLLQRYKEDTRVRGYIYSRRRTYVMYMLRKAMLLKTCVIKKTEI
jgi:hypothetical protein